MKIIAEYPPMGWNSWDCYGAAVNEEQVKQNADYIAKNLLRYGYEYVVVDIEWYQPTAGSHEYVPFSDLCMDEYGRLIPAENRFPSAAGGKGFAPLAEYVHNMGLKLGIHIMRGIPRMAPHNKLPIKNSSYMANEVANPNSICAWNPDMYGLKCETCEEGARDYYNSIFALYAEWGIDFVKVDDIAREYPHCKREIELISEAVRGCGRDMVLSLSPGPAPLDRAEHLKEYANMWRITDDFWDDWSLLLAMFERAEKWCTHAGPGHWPDADMLPIGALRQCNSPDEWTRFTMSELQTMYSLWCMMRSPLMLGGELTKNDAETLKLITNADILAIEKETDFAKQLYRNDEEIAWLASRTDGNGYYVALFNISDSDKDISFDVARYVPDGYSKVTELWTGKAIAVTEGTITMGVGTHGAAVLRFDR